MITRRYRVDKLPEITVAMDYLNQYGGFERIGVNALKQVLMTRPRTAVLKRTPLATAERYDNYVRKDGTKHQIRHNSGAYGALHRAVNTDLVRSVSDAKNAVTFGVHATGTLDYAGYVHEATKPKEGQYWHAGMYGFGRGWTTGTRNIQSGNKYIEKPVVDNADYIPEKTTELIDEKLKEMSL